MDSDFVVYDVIQPIVLLVSIDVFGGENVDLLPYGDRHVISDDRRGREKRAWKGIGTNEIIENGRVGFDGKLEMEESTVFGYSRIDEQVKNVRLLNQVRQSAPNRAYISRIQESRVTLDRVNSSGGRNEDLLVFVLPQQEINIVFFLIELGPGSEPTGLANTEGDVAVRSVFWQNEVPSGNTDRTVEFLRTSEIFASTLRESVTESQDNLRMERTSRLAEYQHRRNSCQVHPR